MLNRFAGVDELEVTELFAGGGGSGTGMMLVPDVKVTFAANHTKMCRDTYLANHPEVEFWLGDVQKEDAIYKFPYAPLFWASPACPRFSGARGEKRFFDKENQMALWAEELTEDQAEGIRSRALMEEVVTYLRHCQEVYGKPVLGFGVENVVEARKWAHWDRWIGELRKLGYIVRVIAINAMHIEPRAGLRSPQSRNRLLVAGIHESVGRVPDWDKWLRPRAYCPKHAGWIQAVQSWKERGQDMGVYGIKNGQYVYRCPLLTCHGQIVEPDVLPASECIDWNDLGTPIGTRKKTKKKPEGMAPATIARIRAGIQEHWIEPFLTHVGGSWNNDYYQLSEPVRTLTTRENTGLVVPMEGRQGKQAKPTSEPIRTQTTRRETGVAFPPESFLTLLRSGRPRNTLPGQDPLATIVADGSNHGLVSPTDGLAPLMTPMRGGGDKLQARRADVDPAHTVTAGGFHHGLVVAPEPLLMSYYGNGAVNLASDPVGTIPTRDRWALLTSDGRIDIDRVLFRMLRIPELARAQCLPAGYKLVAKDQRDKTRLIGNAVPPLMAEVLMCALVEAITGVTLDRFALAA